MLNSLTDERISEAKETEVPGKFLIEIYNLIY